MELQELLSNIRPADGAVATQARARWDALAKPLGSLGALEEAVVRIAALTGTLDPKLDRRALVVYCADNGVVARGVSQCGSEVTAAVAASLAAGESTVCHMARTVRCSVQAVDVGIKDFSGCKGVISCRVRNGTGDISCGPAMTRSQCLSAIRAGAGMAMVQDADILAVGEMGIGNTTTAAATACVLLGESPARLAGRGAGLSDAGLARKVDAIERAIACNHPDRNDPIDVLTKVGGLDLAAMCGAYLGAALIRTPVLVDGVVSAAAALCAKRLCPAAGDAMLASHVSAEPAGRLLLEALELSPLIDAGMRLGEGSGAVAALPLLDAALAVYRSGHSFEQLGIEAYTPQAAK
ncbi:MAG: nicotinate-nucleotide--dimethylbenzimidazole phosphoribosyltransferase [Oscillospiraceae bacterium]|nr:nicotinate-nucleotide--dimethylbenzimidazole phosphoribosyltransferase [Oscillospiraceae bacterium]